MKIFRFLFFFLVLIDSFRQLKCKQIYIKNKFSITNIEVQIKITIIIIIIIIIIIYNMKQNECGFSLFGPYKKNYPNKR